MGLLSVTQGHWLQTRSFWINIHADPSGPNTQHKQADILDPKSGPPPCVPVATDCMSVLDHKSSLGWYTA